MVVVKNAITIEREDMTEQVLIERAIESAKCRIYRVRANVGQSLGHQIKADNQEEIQKVTINALKKQMPKKPNNYTKEYDDLLGMDYIQRYCDCGNKIYRRQSYCEDCGQKIDWNLDK